MKTLIATAAIAATLSTQAFAHNPATPTFWGEFYKLTKMHSIAVDEAVYAQKKYTSTDTFAPSHRPVVDIVTVDYTIHPITCNDLMARKGYLESRSPKYQQVRQDIHQGKSLTVWAKDDKVVTCNNANPSAGKYKLTIAIFDREQLEEAIDRANVNMQNGFSTQNHGNLSNLGKL